MLAETCRIEVIHRSPTHQFLSFCFFKLQYRSGAGFFFTRAPGSLSDFTVDNVYVWSCVSARARVCVCICGLSGLQLHAKLMLWLCIRGSSNEFTMTVACVAVGSVSFGSTAVTIKVQSCARTTRGQEEEAGMAGVEGDKVK